MLARLAAASLALVAAAPAFSLVGATTSTALPAPVSLRGFLLRIDEPFADTFPRTPSFAWQPYPGALSYEFELATSKKFDESSVVWSTASRPRPLRTPVLAIPVSLPWMTGKPYALYAQVRARTRDGTTLWSAPFGFNMRWTNLPQQITASYTGLVRWTPVEGATSYDVWFLDARKVISTVTNVADEREYYTFHRDPSWTGSVNWRVRAVRKVYGQIPNGLPAVVNGPWSSIFTSTNGALAPGALTTTAAVSDGVSTTTVPTAHSLTPGFVFSGDEDGDGLVGSLFRVYVATDSQCVNVVFKGAVVGSPAYAPRTSGPLSLPTAQTTLAAARTSYLADGVETQTFTADYRPLTTSEQPPSSGSTSTKSSSGPTGTTVPTATPTTTTGTTGGTGAGGSSGEPPPLDLSVTGALVDLWDSGWPTGRYYWTVVPVQQIVGASGAISYRDAGVPQDACLAGRALAFGKASQPATTALRRPYATGLTPRGRLVSASGALPSFYGAPLVAWVPALGATAYEIEWSRRLYPWRPASKPVITAATSFLLEGLKPGAWFYRVRGIDPYLPGPVKEMAWSEPVEILIAKPHFTVLDYVPSTASVPRASAAPPRGYVAVKGWSGRFSLSLPKTWRALAKNDPLTSKFKNLAPYSLEFLALESSSRDAFKPSLSVLKGPGRGSKPFARWKASLVADAKSLAGRGPVLSRTLEIGGDRAVCVSYVALGTRGSPWLLQCAIDHGASTYALTFAAAASRKSVYAPLFNKVAASFRVKD